MSTQWVRPKTIAEMMDVSISFVWSLTRSDPTFPKAIKLSPKVAVFEKEAVVKWMNKISGGGEND